MKIKEFLKEAGLYTVPAIQLPETAWFVRDPKIMREKGTPGPLLHICERDRVEVDGADVYMIITEEVKWDSFYGYYECKGCHQKWASEEGLRAIWEDGYGTGDEGTA